MLYYCQPAGTCRNCIQREAKVDCCERDVGETAQPINTSRSILT